MNKKIWILKISVQYNGGRGLESRVVDGLRTVGKEPYQRAHTGIVMVFVHISSIVISFSPGVLHVDLFCQLLFLGYP